MKKIYKIALVIAAVIAVLVGAVALLISPIAKNYIEKHDHELLGRTIRMEKLRINIFTGGLHVTALSIGGAQDSTTFFTLGDFDMKMRLRALLAHRIHVEHITLVQPDLKIYQRGNEFNFDDILSRFQSDSTVVETEPSEPWEIGIYNIGISGGHILYKDLLLGASWGMNDLDLKIPGVYFSGEKTDVGLVLNFAEGGSLETQVGYDIATTDFDIALRLRDFTLANTLPYFRQSLDISSVDGRLTTDLHLRGNTEHLLALTTSGTATLSGFSLRDARQREVASIDSLAIALREADLEKMRFVFDKFHVGGFSTFVELTPQGDNLSALMLPESAPATTTTTEPLTATPEPTLRIADLRINGGRVTLRDMTLAKPFEYRISDIRMHSRDFDPAARNKLLVEARMQKTGAAKLAWDGSLSDIANQNITFTLTNLDLRDFTPYCEHYTAYPLTAGNLTFRSQNVIRNRYLDGTNHLDVYEPKVEKKRKDLTPEFKIPLKLGLYVLKDKKGHVKMDLPVKGSLDSPEFSYRKIVLKAIGNVLLKVVTAPFSFLSGHKDNLEYIDIDPQQYAFTSEQYASFDKIAQMIQDKPEMKIALTQRINNSQALPAQAANALRMAYAQWRSSADTTAGPGAAGTPAITASGAPGATSTAASQAATGVLTAANAATAGLTIASGQAAATTQAAGPKLSLLEYEKIQQIDLRAPAVVAFADSMLRMRGIDPQSVPANAKAMTLYRTEAEAQVAQMAALRNKTLADYMRTTHGLQEPAFRLQPADSMAGQDYSGRHRYTIALELDGESIEVAPAEAPAGNPDQTPGESPAAAPIASQKETPESPAA